MGSVLRGKQVLGYAIKTHFESSDYVVTGLVDMYAKCNCILEAEYLFKMMPDKKNHVMWTAMLLVMLRIVKHSMRLSVMEICVLTACAGAQAGNFGAQVHSCIVRSGFEANVFVQKDAARDMKLDSFMYPSVLNCFALMKDMKNATLVHCLIVKTGFEAYKLVNNALVNMYAKQGNLDCAFQESNHMPNKDVVSWTSLVAGYAHNDRHEEALKLFCDMRMAGIYPDHIVIASILSACAELTVLEFGQQVHANFVKSGLQSSLSVDNSLLTMYAKCGRIEDSSRVFDSKCECIEDASRVFDSMQIHDVIIWIALIVGYAQNGKGLSKESDQSYFASMEKVNGIEPGPEHYACMIDLLGRSGKLFEAGSLLNQMDVEPYATVWKALLAACRVQGNLELGERAAKNLFELEPTNAVPFIMLSNMYSANGKWEETARIRRMMKSRGINKEPGCS
ncbi:hypothetical protein CRYUN_Cryun14cG0029400 [Craigia yunnanensis]